MFYLIEHSISYLFNINLDTLNFGFNATWLALLVIYGFKFHIFCCLIPLIITSYKCRHKKCNHKQCKKV